MKPTYLIKESNSELILSFSFLPEQNQLRFDLRNGSRLYIIYNDFDEYAYQLNFSYNPLDRIRFDDYSGQPCEVIYTR